MSREHHLLRPRGNLLPRAREPETAKPCMRFTMNVEHYNRTGEVIPLTEPEEFIPPADVNPFNDWVSNPDSFYYKEENEMPRGVQVTNKPTKEQLAEDVKTMTNKEIADKYGLAKPTIARYIKEYGVQRRNLNGDIPSEDIHIDKAVNPDPAMSKPVGPQPGPVNPNMKEVEELFTEPGSALPKVEDKLPTSDDPDEKIWQNIEADIRELHKRKIERAELEFQDRLLKLLECC